MIIILIICVLVIVALSYKIYRDKDYVDDLKEDLEDSEMEKNELERECERYYKNGNQKIQNMREEKEEAEEKLKKVMLDLADTNKKLDDSIMVRRQLEKKLEVSEKMLNDNVSKLYAALNYKSIKK